MERYIPRHFDNLQNLMMSKRVTVLQGPRRAGKTTLINHYLVSSSGQTDEASPHGARVLRACGDRLSERSLLSNRETRVLLEWVSGYDTVFIDEAQRIPDIGGALRMLMDSRPELTVIAAGSSSFDLTGKFGEVLTGRQVPVILFPLSAGELRAAMNDFELRQNLEDLLVFGMYPEVRTCAFAEEKKKILNELADVYLLKDILEIEHIKKPQALVNLLTLIALKIGSELSLHELGGELGIDMKTVERYLDLLEKYFVLYRLRGFSRNLRNEVAGTGKYYFYDTGIRNTVIKNFNPLSLRNDAGALWENFMVIERLKTRSYNNIYARDYFWRTWEKQKIDLLEEYEGRLHALEFKWPAGKAAKLPSAFGQSYPDASYEVVGPDNFLEYI
ncbi:MAG: AAA family ATPase [Treponema sp.]|jgi:predicted AAA+ superfamily ATPase|nr:AAA family ATPase [Treponema sp.]